MAKLTKVQRNTLSSTLADIDRALTFINSDQIALCAVSEINAQVPKGPKDFRSGEIVRSKDYEHRDPNEPGWTIDFVHELTPLSKGVGSDLVALYTAKQRLTTLLEAE